MKVVISDGQTSHTGSTVVGAVAGSISNTGNTLFRIEGKLIMVEGDTMEIPTHKYDFGPPPLFHSHSFAPNTLQNNHFYIENKLVVLVGDKYSSDPTEIVGAGSNTFVEVN